MSHVAIGHYGSIVLIRPLSPKVANWLEEHTDGTWWGGALVVEPRYADDLLDALAKWLRDPNPGR